jgi:VIT1/CCC1 family predicted Fe2+/Mn2+ transporter
MKNILIILGIFLLLLVCGFYIFPLVVVAFKAVIGLVFILLIVIGIYIGYIIPKKKKK